MRSPLPALQAFAHDAHARPSDTGDHDERLAGWLAVTKTAERLSMLDAKAREAYLADIAIDVLPNSEARPTLVHDARGRPADGPARLAERFRIEAEQMERSGCFEMAFATVSAVCSFSRRADLATRMLATIHLGRIARQLGDLDAATDCYQMAADESLRERDGPLAARAFVGLGNVADSRGNRPTERVMFERALSLAHPGGPTDAMASQGLMNVALAERRLIDALLHGWRAFDLTPEQSEERAMILSNLALASLHGDFTTAALGGFLHVLTLTDTARIRLPAVGGAIRAAARLREDTRVASLNTSGDHEAGRARLPFESARFLLHAGEAWATVGDRDFARRRLLDAHAIAVRHRFFELQMKAEDAMEALDRNAAVVPATNLTASSVLVDSDGGPVVRAGIERLESLSV